MAKNLLNKYVWLVETIYKAGRITFEEIPSGREIAGKTKRTWNKYDQDK